MPFPPATKESSFEFEAALDEHVCGLPATLIYFGICIDTVYPAFLRGQFGHDYG